MTWSMITAERTGSLSSPLLCTGLKHAPKEVHQGLRPVPSANPRFLTNGWFSAANAGALRLHLRYLCYWHMLDQVCTCTCVCPCACMYACVCCCVCARMCVRVCECVSCGWVGGCLCVKGKLGAAPPTHLPISFTTASDLLFESGTSAGSSVQESLCLQLRRSLMAPRYQQEPLPPC